MEQLSEKTIKALEIAAGIVLGLGIWVLLWLSSNTKDGLLQYAWLVVAAAALLGPRAAEKKLGRPMKTYRLALLISMAVGLAAFALLAFVFKVLPAA